MKDPGSAAGAGFVVEGGSKLGDATTSTGAGFGAAAAGGTSAASNAFSNCVMPPPAGTDAGLAESTGVATTGGDTTGAAAFGAGSSAWNICVNPPGDAAAGSLGGTDARGFGCSGAFGLSALNICVKPPPGFDGAGGAVEALGGVNACVACGSAAGLAAGFVAGSPIAANICVNDPPAAGVEAAGGGAGFATEGAGDSIAENTCVKEGEAADAGGWPADEAGGVKACVACGSGVVKPGCDGAGGGGALFAACAARSAGLSAFSNWVNPEPGLAGGGAIFEAFEGGGDDSRIRLSESV